MSSDRPRYAALLAVFFTACAGTLEDPDRFRVDAAGIDAGADAGGDGSTTTCGSVENDILHARCGTAGCHAAAGSSAGLDLASPDILGRLSGKAPTGGGGVLIVKGDPANSVLYQKLTASPPFGARMPLGSQLDDTTLACVHDWIQSAK